MSRTVRHPFRIFSLLSVISILFTTVTFANTTVTVDRAVHVTTAEGSDLVLGMGDYVLEPAQDWIRVTPSDGNAVDAHLLEAQVGEHTESLEDPLAVSLTGVEADSHHLVLLLPNGKSFETTGSYSGIRARGLSRADIQRMIAAAAKQKKAQRTEFVTQTFGGSGGNRSYNLDCGRNAVLVGGTYKAGSWLDSIGIICQRINPQTGSLGDQFTRGPVGGHGGKAVQRQCDDGRVVQAIRVVADRFMHGLIFDCRPWDSSLKAPTFTRDSECERFNEKECIVVGTLKGSFNLHDRFYCPRGKTGKALRGRSGIYIDSMRFVCDFWNK